MKQRQYTELQLTIMNILGRIERHLRKTENEYVLKEIEEIKKDYDIEPPYLTLREYIQTKSYGAYHTFHFSINGEEIVLNTLGDFLTDELCHLYAETNKYYVVKDDMKDNGGDMTNYHCDHYLTLELKED